MQTKAHILVVEDEAPIYKRLKTVLKKEYYSVAPYAPSVADALELISQKKPDLVLLDINLQGKENGIYLGDKLHNELYIPFIYVTSLDDDQTFYEGLETFHEDYIVKTKPRLVPKVLIRKIQTVLKRQELSLIEENTLANEFGGIQGLVDYLKNIKNYGKGVITKIPISFNEIAYFTTNPYINKQGVLESIKRNYLRFYTINNEAYFFDSSLNDLYITLPKHFARVNDSTIVNLSKPFFKGKINNSKIVILNQQISITSTYKKEFEKRYNCIYKTTKNQVKIKP
jgi:DNA-binding response OmpR family regulator